MATEDLIDFPVSGLWRDYYYDQGLTPRHSCYWACGCYGERDCAIHRPAPQAQREIDDLRRELERMKRSLHIHQKPSQGRGTRGDGVWLDSR